MHPAGGRPGVKWGSLDPHMAPIQASTHSWDLEACRRRQVSSCVSPTCLLALAVFFRSALR